jgi:hypothetical protein
MSDLAVATDALGAWMERWIVRFATLMPCFSNSPRMRSAPHSRVFVASSLISAIVFGASLDSRMVVRDVHF